MSNDWDRGEGREAYARKRARQYHARKNRLRDNAFDSEEQRILSEENRPEELAKLVAREEDDAIAALLDAKLVRLVGRDKAIELVRNALL